MLVLLTALVGCGPPPEPFLHLGTGERRFEPLTDGDEAEIVFGPQGGWHIVGAMQVAGVHPGDPDDLSAPDNPTTIFEVWHGDTQLDIGARYTQGLDDAGQRGVYEMLGRLLVLAIDDDDPYVGEPLTITVTVTDVDGVTMTASADLIGAAAPTNP